MSTESTQEPQTFDKAYVTGLRAEAADWRTKYRELEADTRPIFKKGFLPPEVKFATTDISVHVPKFPKGDVDNFSLSRAAYAQDQARHGDRGKAWAEIATWEKQYLDAMQEVKYKANMGDSVSGQDGAYIAPEFWSSQWFDVLRSISAIDQLPVTRFQLPYRKAYIPKITNDVTVTYPGENNSASTTVYKFGQVTATARKAVAYFRASNELIRDAGDLADNIFRQSTAGAIAIDRDSQIFLGNTASQPSPTGMIFMPQIPVYYPGATTTTPLTSTGATGTPFYQTIAQVVNKVESLNGNANVSSGQAVCNGFVANSQFKQTLFSSPRFLDSSNRPMWFTDPNVDGGFFGGKWALSNVIPTAATVNGQGGSIIIAGWWQKFALFECMTLGYSSTMESQAFANDQTEIRVIHRWDASCINPEAFVILAGLAV